MNLFEDTINIDFKQEIIKTITSVLDSGNLVGNDKNPLIVSFATFLQENYFPSKECVTCASGTDALYGLYKTLSHNKPKKWLIPDLTWLSTGTAAFQAGQNFDFCPVDNNGLIDLDYLSGIDMSEYYGVVAVHLFGNVVDIDMIRGKYPHLKIIEDCAQAFGSTFSDGTYVGSKGDGAAFSLFPTKNLGTTGDGGFCVIGSDMKNELVSIFKLGQGDTKGIITSDVIGINSRLDALHCAVAHKKLELFHDVDFFGKRKSLLSKMHDLLSGCKDINVVTNANDNVSPHLLIIHSLNAEECRIKLKDNGIPFLHHYKYSLSETSLSKKASAVFRKDYNIWKDFITLPFHLNLTDQDLSLLHKVLK